MVTHLQATFISAQHHLIQTSIEFKALRTNFFGKFMGTNELKLKREQTKPKGLWQRDYFKTNNFSSFGMLLVSSDGTDLLFEMPLHTNPIIFKRNGN
jgi:hypothetical protein